MPKHAQKRLICTDFDSTCLEGGCGYCNDNGVWMDISTIRSRALSRRRQDFVDAFRWGLENDFANAQVEYSDGSLKFARDIDPS